MDSGKVQKVKSARLLTGSVGKTLVSLAIPMGLGLVTIFLFNIVDTFYVGQLGAKPLAAMGFTFPVTYIVMSVAMGFSVGASSTISRAIGEGQQDKVRRLATDVVGLSFLIVTLFAMIGLTSLRGIFTLMGADDETLGLISDYMIPWFLGVGLLGIPIVSNGAIRATGDTKSPAVIMAIAGLVNIVLDPFLIFGIGPFPRLELRGAALASVISWSLTFAATIWILGKRARMLGLPLFDAKRSLESWRQILRISLPAAGTNILEPLSLAVLTRMVVQFGEEAVAAFGVGSRIESLALIGVAALSIAVSPFVGQNFGAGNCDRIRAALRFGLRFSMGWGIVIFVILFSFAEVIAPVFNDDPAVITSAALFLMILPISYGFLGISWMVNSTFNALNQPLRAAVVILLHLFAFVLPLAYLGSRLRGLKGLFIGMTFGHVLVGISAYLMAHKSLTKVESEIQTPITEDAESLPR